MSKTGIFEDLIAAPDHAADEGTGVVLHLRRLLNAVKGEALACPDFGIEHIADVHNQGRSPSDVVREQIRQAIERFEPRLSDVRLTDASEDKQKLRMRFVVDATMMVGGVAKQVRFETRIDALGHVDVW